MGGPSARAINDAQDLARWKRLYDLLPPGWTLEGERFVPIDTPAGARARGQAPSAGCARPDCRRRVQFDLEDLVRSEHRDASFATVLAHLKCSHWRGCALELRPAIYPGGVPLITLIQHKDAVIEIGCVHCPHVSRLSPEAVIAFLRRTGAGDGNTGVHGLAETIRGRCPRCRGVRFWTGGGGAEPDVHSREGVIARQPSGDILLPRLSQANSGLFSRERSTKPSINSIMSLGISSTRIDSMIDEGVMLTPYRS